MDTEFDILEVDQSSDRTFRTIFLSLVKDIMTEEVTDNTKIFYAIIQKLSSLCEKKAVIYLENLDKDLLIKIYNIIHKYQNEFHYTTTFITKIRDIIQNKNETSECIILNPTLDDIYNETLYKLVANKHTYAIPLWHHELVYDNCGKDLYVKCIPQLPENVEIDTNNDIYIVKSYTIQNIFNSCKIMINCGPHYLVVDIEELKLLKEQRITFLEKGILCINPDDIYNTTHRSNVYIDIILSI
jgi:hypothetical protein